MKKVIATLMCVMFVTVLFAQVKNPPTKVDVKPGELPKCITEWIAKNLPSYTVVKAYKLETKKGDQIVWMYYVQTKLDKQIQWITGDSNCNEVKKINPKEAETAPKTKPPTTKN